MFSAHRFQLHADHMDHARADILKRVWLERSGPGYTGYSRRCLTPRVDLHLAGGSAPHHVAPTEDVVHRRPAVSVQRHDLTGLHDGLEHAHLLTSRPRDASPDALQALLDAGWTTDGVVTVSQLVAFTHFQLRVVAGLTVLKGDS